MYWVRVDGYPLPSPLGGHPALEFCNTWSGWHDPPNPRAEPHERREWLPDFDTFAVWSGHAGLLDEAAVAAARAAGRAEPQAAASVMTKARVLRNALYALLTAPSSGGSASAGSASAGSASAGSASAGSADFAVVAALAQRAAAASRLVPVGDGLARRALPADLGPPLPLLAVAQAAEDLLTSPARRTVHRCPGTDCGWLFLDPRGRRRWCSMSTCGNRSKVRAHAARHA